MRTPGFTPFNIVLVCSYLLLSLFTEILLATDTFVIRNTTYGHVLGQLYRTNNFTAEVFLGVPYAEAPINDLRFKNPTAPKWWVKQKICTDFRPYCVQFLPSSVEENEDCLYLNIIVPYKTKNKSLLYPVLVWIHGGSFHGDGANMFPLDGTINNIVSQGIVVVFVNYRVGPFGYLSSFNESLPGNFGIEDQLFALKWVRDNIHWFDGNADHVTLSGESAGAASASLLALSPKAKGLFRYLMLRSGSSLAPWAVSNDRTRINSAFIIKQLSCDTTPNLLSCLQNRTVKEIKKSWLTMTRDANLLFDANAKLTRNLPLNHVALTYLTPIVDKFRVNDSILPDEPRRMLQYAPSVPLVAGTTTAECLNQLHSICVISSFIRSLHTAIAQASHDDDEELEFNVAPKHQYEFPFSDENKTLFDWESLLPKSLFHNPQLVYQAVQMKYFDQFEIKSTNKSEKLKTLTKAMSDLFLVVPLMLEAEHYANFGLPVYFYKFDHKHPLLASKLTECADSWDYRDDALHGLDIALLFQSASVLGYELNITNWTTADLSITKMLSNQVSNFVKFGNPNSKELETHKWSRYSKPAWNALHFESGMQFMSSTDQTILHFWDETISMIDRLKGCDTF